MPARAPSRILSAKASTDPTLPLKHDQRCVDVPAMPDLSKALGDVYGQAATKPFIGDRQIDDDLAAALSAALVNAPAVPAVTVGTDGAAGAFAGALRDLSSAGSPAETALAPVTVPEAKLTPATETPLPGPPWRREDDDILPGATKKASRGLHLGRR